MSEPSSPERKSASRRAQVQSSGQQLAQHISLRLKRASQLTESFTEENSGQLKAGLLGGGLALVFYLLTRRGPHDGRKAPSGLKQVSCCTLDAED